MDAQQIRSISVSNLPQNEIVGFEPWEVAHDAV